MPVEGIIRRQVARWPAAFVAAVIASGCSPPVLAHARRPEKTIRPPAIVDEHEPVIANAGNEWFEPFP